ncbi:MAG: TRAP transporter large permease subunit [Vicinamibacterales bacterium]
MIHRDVSITRDLLRVFAECVGLIGGVLVILGVAVGLTSWMVGAQVPMHLVEFTRAHIESRTLFLLALNVFLILVGCLMEIFPAIVVVVPLIVPLGQAFDVHPVHLGIIFIANLELGYLTPLVGLNILLASYRFKKSGPRGRTRRAADGRHSRHRRPRDHLCSGADSRYPESAGPPVVGGSRRSVIRHVPLLTLDHVSHAFGHLPLLDDVSLQIDARERVSIIGRNGTGKSTLLQIISGELIPDSGTVWQQPALRVARLVQDVPLTTTRTVFEVVAEGLAGPPVMKRRTGFASTRSISFCRASI